MIENLHFLYPLWLLALIPLSLILFITPFRHSASQAWSKVIDPNLLGFLMQGDNTSNNPTGKGLLAIAWLLTIIALADPVWEKIPRPMIQTSNARVIVLDLSNSMLIDDIKPTRLARAKFKIEDVLSKKEEIQTALVVFAGDAFTVAPLTRDADTILSLLNVLKPQIMPSQGSRVDLGISKAHELLKQAGINHGQVLLVADGASKLDAAKKAISALTKNGHQLNILGVGTPVSGTLRFRDSKPITIPFKADELQQLAELGNGHYRQITANGNDLEALLSQAHTQNNKATSSIKNNLENTEDWKSNGPYVVFLLIPFAALAFRKGWLLSVLMSVSLLALIQPQPVYAESFSWESLWKNKEQRAYEALKNKQYDQAATLSTSPALHASAAYKNGQYDQALHQFQSLADADAHYNEGNTLAKLKKYKEAIKAYEKALSLSPTMKDASANKKAIEDFLKKQQQKKNKKHDKQDPNQKDKKQNSQQQKNGGQKKSSKNPKKPDQKQRENKQGQHNKGEKGEQKQKKDKASNQFSDANKTLKEQQKNKTEKQEPRKNSPQNTEKKDEKKQDSKAQQAKEKAKASQRTNKEKPKLKGTNAQAKTLTKEEKMAAEQWLRRIPDDPGGLLREKFRRQYQQRRRQQQNDSENPW